MVFNKVLEVNGIFKKIVERKEKNILGSPEKLFCYFLLLLTQSNQKQLQAFSSSWEAARG